MLSHDHTPSRGCIIQQHVSMVTEQKNKHVGGALCSVLSQEDDAITADFSRGNPPNLFK